ncbi:hypothetical protein D3C81_910700 [compost metagenome]
MLVAAGELELLVDGFVALGVDRIHIQVEAVGRVFLGVVGGIVLTPGRRRGQVAPAQCVVDDQADAVEGAPFGVVGIAEGGRLARVEEVILVRRHGRALRVRRQGDDAGGDAAILVQAFVIPADVGGGVVAERHLPGRTRGPHVLAAQVLAGGTVLEPAIAGVDQRVEAQRGVVAGGNVPHRIGVLLAVVAHAHGGACFGFGLRPARHQRDRAGGGVAAEQGALRPLQYFDAFDIDKRQQYAATAPAVDAIDEDADRRVGADAEIAGLHAAQAEGRLCRLHRVDHQARHEGVDVAEVFRRHVTEQVLVHHLQRDRYVLEFLLAALRSDGDPVQRGGRILRGRLRHRRPARSQHHQPGNRPLQPCYQTPLFHSHRLSPKAVGESRLRSPAVPSC